ncbi:uncharacterized protein [Rutidosis leptorrhynchoides]|uniref:uncharacterized protein isoform X2 n=1 Tax=Rutidosis leptorrhynchoides TaxID=125765 RepID=UPI003A99A67B
MEFSYEDCVSLLEQTNAQEKEVRNKRRWLIGLPSSVNEAEKKGSHISRRPIPEYLLREDDVSYEIIKSFVEKKFGLSSAKNNDPTTQDDMQLITLPRDATSFLPLIDNMTNQGLEHFADVMTGGTVKFEKTRWKMKQFIKQHLSNVLSNTGQLNLTDIQFSILKNPRSFHWSSESRFIPGPGSYHVAVHNILNILDDLPTQTLTAMHRKLKGTKGYVPKLIPKKSGWGRDTLIARLRKACSNLLTKLNDDSDSLPEPLAKSMEVAALYMKLIQGYQHVTNFRQVSPDVNALQSEIAMSIQLIDNSLKLSVLKAIQVLLDPKAKLSERSLRACVRNVLTEYLFECGDMDTVPQCLREILRIIRRRSSKGSNIMSSTETKIKEDVDCILNVSACMKQILWDLIPEHDLDLDLEFADAYMEDLVDDDDDFFDIDESEENNILESGISDENVAIAGDNFNCIEHSTESRLSNFSEVKNLQCTGSMGYHMVSIRNTEDTKSGSVHDTDNEDGLPNSSHDMSESGLMFGDQSMCKNQYLAVQGACDETSMVAYNLIGRMLSDFVQKEGCEVDSGDMSYLGAGSYDLKRKKHKARKKSATCKEDKRSISDKSDMKNQ